MSEELKDCPFCGGVGELDLNDRNDYYVGCDTCGGLGTARDTEKEAIKHWNTRTTPNVERALEEIDRHINHTESMPVYQIKITLTTIKNHLQGKEGDT